MGGHIDADGHHYRDRTDEILIRAVHWVAGDKITLDSILKLLHGLGHLFAPIPPAGTVVIPNLPNASNHQQYTDGIAEGEEDEMRNRCMTKDGTHLMREGQSQPRSKSIGAVSRHQYVMLDMQ